MSIPLQKALGAPSPLPLPDPVAIGQSQALAAHVARLIASGEGFLPFEDFMREVLYAPGLGYYSGASHKLGVGGDFVTAPELSPLFGAALAHQLAQICRLSSPDILELGAGTGQLALQVMNEFKAQGWPVPRYAILEVSADLSARQRSLLSEAGWLEHITWLTQLPETLSGAVIANEVLDAIPCKMAELGAQGWQEVGVTVDEELRFAYRMRPASSGFLADLRPVLDEIGEVAAPFRLEFNPAAQGLIASIAERLQHGAAVFFDYGFPSAEMYHPQRREGTLMAHYRHHAHPDPFVWPGLQDITAHVDFTAMAHAANDAGADLLGYTSQGRFLLNCGLIGMMDGALAPKARAQMTHGLDQLLSEAHMGELFKVLAFGRGIDGPLLGFQSGDRLHRL